MNTLNDLDAIDGLVGQKSNKPINILREELRELRKQVKEQDIFLDQISKELVNRKIVARETIAHIYNLYYAYFFLACYALIHIFMMIYNYSNNDSVC